MKRHRSRRSVRCRRRELSLEERATSAASLLSSRREARAAGSTGRPGLGAPARASRVATEIRWLLLPRDYKLGTTAAPSACGQDPAVSKIPAHGGIRPLPSILPTTPSLGVGDDPRMSRLVSRCRPGGHPLCAKLARPIAVASREERVGSINRIGAPATFPAKPHGVPARAKRWTTAWMCLVGTARVCPPRRSPLLPWRKGSREPSCPLPGSWRLTREAGDRRSPS